MEQIEQAAQAIEHWVQKGFLTNQRPAGLRFQEGREEVLRHLSSELRQLILGVTQSCNLRCRYCVYGGTYEHFRAHDAEHMPQDIAQKALDFFMKHSTADEPASISFYGGEPLINFPLISYCVDYCRTAYPGRDVYFNLTTNGTLLKSEMREFLAKYDVILRVSIDGPAEIHDTNRVYLNGERSFDIVRDNLAALKKVHEDYFRRRVSISAVAGAPYRLDDVRSFFENDPLFDGVSISINGVRSPGTEYHKKFPAAYDPEEIASLRRSYVQQAVSGRTITPVLKALYEPGLTPIALRPIERLAEFPPANQVCVPGVQRLFVDIHGRFQPCERFNDTVFIGDVDRGFDEARLFGLIDDYIRISERECRDCWAIRLCRTCFISANGNGMDAAYKRKHCARERRSLEGSLALYCTLMERDGDCLNHLRNLVFR